MDMMLGDICAGLRTIILKEDSPEGRVAGRRPNCFSQSDRIEGNQEGTLIVYRTYRQLLEEDTQTQRHSHDHDGEADGDAESEDECTLLEDEQRQRRHDREKLVKDLQVCPEMMPISWHSFLMWVQKRSDLADDCKVKSTCGFLNRALKAWRDLEASAAQSVLGVSLNMMLQWIWPCATYDNIARMLTWIGRHEFEKIRQPTPRVISREDRAQLESIFKNLDHRQQGHISAEDLAGGAAQDSEAKVRNIVDADTVKAVYGSADIAFFQFLEIMCEDNFRGHEDAMTAQLEDGRRLVYVSREVTRCSGWLLRDAPKSEESQRALVDAIELEVGRWKNLGQIQRKNVTHASCSPQRQQSQHFNPEPTELLPSSLAKVRKTLAAGSQAVAAGGAHSALAKSVDGTKVADLGSPIAGSRSRTRTGDSSGSSP
jgi:hypothetical protein